MADEDTYSIRLEQAIAGALQLTTTTDEPIGRLVVHLGKKTGQKEIRAAKQAVSAAGLMIPVALLRLDDSSLYDIADGRNDTLAPPKGIALRTSRRQAVLQTEGLSPLGPPYGPLLVELDPKSDVGADKLDDLVAQTFRLAHANWRGFNARSQPVTLVYGELLAQLVGYLEEVATWDSTLLRNELRDRPWFL